MCSSFLRGTVLAGLLTIACGVQARELRVCADPNNLPFSNEAGEGFEVLVLSVDDPDQGTDLTEDGVHVEVGVFEDVDLAGEVPDLEVHEGAGGRKI